MKFLKDNSEWLFPIAFTVILTIIMAIASHFMN